MRLYDVIKNETDALNGGSGTKSVLAWKFSGEDFYDRSQLIVGEAEEAVLFRDGLALKVFPGGRHTLDTSNHPFLTPLRSRLSNGKNAFSCKVYFVNKDHKLELKWGTDTPIQVRDPVLRITTQVQARGSYSIQVADSKKFLIKLVGNNIQMFTHEELTKYYRSAFLQSIKDAIADHLMNSGREILDVANKKAQLAEQLKKELVPLLDEYGVELVNFYIASIDIPDSEQRAKLEGAFGDKGVMGILSEDWARQQSAEILRDLANNPGAGGVAAAGAGLGMGMAAGGVFNEMARNLVVSPTPPVSAPPGPAHSATAGLFPVREAPSASATVTCPSCLVSVPPGKFCADCGRPLQVSCPACAIAAAPGAKFCAACGHRFGGAQ
jgi:membrane protease subunit (stomatin/prohibitin family)